MLNSAAPVDLSVVVVNWNSGKYLARLLRSLEGLRSELKAVLVVDNGSNDGSTDLQESELAVEVLKLGANLGFGGGANEGIRRVSSEFVLLLNPDTSVNEVAIRNLFQSISKRPKAAIVCGALVGEGGQLQESFQIRSLPSVWSVVRDALFLDELFVATALFRHKKLERLEGPVEQPAAAFWLLRKSAWSSVGGFDERFFPAWFEDVDLCKRLKDAGWLIYYFPQWSIRHKGGVALEHLSYSEFVDIYYRNLIRYWRKHHSRSLFLIWLPVQVGIQMRKLFVRR